MSGVYANTNGGQPICIISTGDSLNAMLQRFWEVDNLDQGRAFTAEEQRCEDHFRRTVRREPDGRFTVRLPLRDDRVAYLGDSSHQAQRRFMTTERRFQTDPTFRDAYFQFMEEYARLGHMEPARPTAH